MQRRSTTRNTPRKKYTVDAFEGIEELQDARSDNEDAVEQEDVHDDSAEEFSVAAAESSEDDDDAMSGVEADAEAADIGGDDHAGEADLDDSMSIADEDVDNSAPRASAHAPKKRPAAPPRKAANGAPNFTRGILETHAKSMSKESRLLHLYGSDERDQNAAINSKDRWAVNPTLPSRNVDGRGLGGMARSLFLDADAWAEQAKIRRTWWKGQGGEAIFAGRQILTRLSADDATEYLGPKRSSRLAFLMGPFESHRFYELELGRSVRLRDDIPSAVEDGSTSGPTVDGGRSGFMLNVGSRVQSIDWAPRPTGDQQFLALSTQDRREDVGKRFQAAQAPAFHPQPGCKSNVQLWRFQCKAKGAIDMNFAPCLQTVLCNTWGGARMLKWQSVIYDEDYSDRRVLLAGVWTDGAVRVLNIELDAGTDQTSFIQIESAAIESRSSDTIFTCITWISSTRLAAGCANGCIAVWDLTNLKVSDPINVRPTIFTAATSAYILSIATCSPSRPNLILTSTIAGYITVSDLSRSAQSLTSQASTVYGSKNRMSVPTVVWHDYSQVGLHVDDAHQLRGTSIRRTFTSTALARYKSAATCVASSPCHPIVLVGTANGDVVATNPTARTMDGKATIWQQTVFNHEWRRPLPPQDAVPNGQAQAGASQPPTATASSVDSSAPPRSKLADQSLSRILDGFKAERCTWSSTERNPWTAQDGVPFATIYEERSAITALAWNPNLQVGGWVAAGMGDGLVRIEDVALDP